MRRSWGLAKALSGERLLKIPGIDYFWIGTNFKLDRLERDKGSKVKVLAGQG
jgi:hypothetical protein